MAILLISPIGTMSAKAKSSIGRRKVVSFIAFFGRIDTPKVQKNRVTRKKDGLIKGEKDTTKKNNTDKSLIGLVIFRWEPIVKYRNKTTSVKKLTIAKPIIVIK
ncbi:hypothetical protein I6N95_14785 [Vagococcus sp. BWB3-3]|uniref:Uncharacterized protein n=1 Tax=Vagococcus allomyrinae TaxID=2794353 RepID=A0A940SXE6_9ENTE|nr:hypothetical protein [Vagococcus allomyrinae]MBP1042283.1 hypothetical protein [Vagococcus allomyrinae]